MIQELLGVLKGTIFHPQWLSDRYHQRSKKVLRKVKNTTILDIGSGNASYKNSIEKLNNYFSLDYPGTNKGYSVRPDVFADAHSLPFADDSVDVVLLFEVLEHVNDPSMVLNEIQRVLRPEGEFYMSVPFIYPIHDAPNDYWRFTIYGVENILFNHGLKIDQLKIHGNTLISSMQLFNLGLLEVCRDLLKRSKLVGLVSVVFAYPVTLVVNLLACFFILVPLGKVGNLGCFLVARQKDK